MEFPSLFEIANNGKEKIWSIKVIDLDNNVANIITEYGYVGGKMIKNIKSVDTGKNLGKKNETTYLEQAINIAKTLFISKKNSGYKEKNGEDNNEIKNNSKKTNQDIPNPMLAHNYTDHDSKIKFPCIIQPKIDGVRCLAIPNDGLYSRNKKIFNNLDYILKEVSSINLILDGELFSKDISFQEIIAVTKTESKKEMEKIYLHVYDIILYDKTYKERIDILTSIFENNKFEYLKLLKTEICNEKKNIDIKHNEYVKEGHEGIMIKNIDSLYEGKRSYNLQKYKKFFDKEYEIVNFTEGKGLENGCVIWICKNENNKQFSCRPTGTRDERKELLKNGNKYIGKYLTVKYQNMTNDGLPRFPVGLSIRDYE